jgi:hypothetical protein
MNMRSTKLLAVVAVALILGVVVLDTANNDSDRPENRLLLPDLKERINDINAIVIRQGETTTTVTKNDNRWVVSEKDDYPANTGALRQLMLALADAEKIEQKTSNPAMHEKLGLAAIGTGDAIGVSLDGADFHQSLIIGNVAQQNFRYVRFADDDQSWLIDKNPDLPGAAGGWLAPDLVDIASARVKSVTVTHTGGDTIDISRDSSSDNEYAVANIPAGRELTYPGIVNGMAGALQNLDLEDVRKRPDDVPEADVNTVFTTFDGLTISARRYLRDDASWFAISAGVMPGEADSDEAQDAETEDAAAAGQDAGPAPAGEEPGTAAMDTGAGQDTESADAESRQDTAKDPAQEAETINASLDGWIYKLPSSKTSLLIRGWSDVLKAPDEDDDEDEG